MDPWSKTTSLKTGFRYSATQRISFPLLSQACQFRLQDLIFQLQGHFQDRKVIAQHFLQARYLHLQKVISILENERIELKVTSLQLLCQLLLMRDRGDPSLIKSVKFLKKKRTTERTVRHVFERTGRPVIF